MLLDTSMQSETTQEALEEVAEAVEDEDEDDHFHVPRSKEDLGAVVHAFTVCCRIVPRCFADYYAGAQQIDASSGSLSATFGGPLNAGAAR